LVCDPKEVSPARAAASFSEYAKKLAIEKGIDFTQAWNQAKTLEPELHARMCETTPLPNSAGLRVPPPFSAVSSNKADIARKFLLPANVDDALIEKAWQANGSQYSGVDFIKVFLAVQTYLMQTKNWNAEAAKSYMMDNFRSLCESAKQMPVLQSGATDTSGMKL